MRDVMNATKKKTGLETLPAKFNPQRVRPISQSVQTIGSRLLIPPLFCFPDTNARPPDKKTEARKPPHIPNPPPRRCLSSSPATQSFCKQPIYFFLEVAETRKRVAAC